MMCLRLAGTRNAEGIGDDGRAEASPARADPKTMQLVSLSLLAEQSSFFAVTVLRFRVLMPQNRLTKDLGLQHGYAGRSRMDPGPH